MKKFELLELINTLKIDRDDFYVLSSGALVLRGLLDNANDLDMRVTEKCLEKLKEQFNVKQKENGWYYVSDDIECCVGEMDSYELHEGVNLESLEKYFRYLKTSLREKDLIRYRIVKEELIKRNLLQIHEMRLHDEPFKLIKNKTKTVELRLNDLKRQQLKIGDIITFISRASGESLDAVITNLYKFKDFKELYDNFDKVAIGYSEDDVVNPKDMEQYYEEEDIKKYGTLAIELKAMI